MDDAAVAPDDNTTNESVQTGDSSPIVFNVVLMMAAVGVGIAYVIKNKRREQEI